MKARVSASLQTFFKILTFFLGFFPTWEIMMIVYTATFFTTKFCEYTYSTVISFPFENI